MTCGPRIHLWLTYYLRQFFNNDKKPHSYHNITILHRQNQVNPTILSYGIWLIFVVFKQKVSRLRHLRFQFHGRLRHRPDEDQVSTVENRHRSVSPFPINRKTSKKIFRWLKLIELLICDNCLVQSYVYNHLYVLCRPE